MEAWQDRIYRSASSQPLLILHICLNLDTRNTTIHIFFNIAPGNSYFCNTFYALIVKYLEFLDRTQFLRGFDIFAFY